MPPRKLSPDSVVSAAMEVADRDGIERLTMRSLAQVLGVEAMSLYHHFAGKEALLDAMVDRVYAEIELPSETGDWRDELRRRSRSVRSVLARHPWALQLMESRHSPGPANLAYHEATIACLRAAGFPAPLVAHAYAVLDAFVYGFALQEQTLPFDTGPQAQQMIQAEPWNEAVSNHPNMGWFAREVILVPGYSFGREFEPGLDLVLAGLAALCPPVPSAGAQPTRSQAPRMGVDTH